MNATETLAAEVSNIVSANSIYQAYQAQWKYLLESYIGGTEYKDAGHLTRYQLETDGEYAARLRSTPLDNHCRSVVSVYNSFLFRESAQRNYGSIEYIPELEDFLHDADFDGRSLDAFMKDVATFSSVFGHAWIVVAKPNIGAVTRAEELSQGIRPYVNLLTPLTCLDWRWERQPSGRYDLEYFKYLEDVNGDVRTVKTWTKDLIKTFVVDVNQGLILEQIEEVNGLGSIPAVICYNGRSTVRGIGVSDIADIADAQKFIYNATSEVEQSIRLDSHPSLVKTPETQAGIGAGSVIHMPDNLDPGLRPFLLEFSGASVDSIYTCIKHTIESIDKMANTGAVRATESRTLSGVAMETEFQLLNARLSEKADNIELAEEHLWTIWCRYMGYVWNGSVDYPGSFNMRDTDAEVERLAKAKTVATDPRVFQILDQQLLQVLGEDPNMIRDTPDASVIPAQPPFDVHVMIDPESGQEYYARSEAEHVAYAQLGYVHEKK